MTEQRCANPECGHKRTQHYFYMSGGYRVHCLMDPCPCTRFQPAEPTAEECLQALTSGLPQVRLALSQTTEAMKQAAEALNIFIRTFREWYDALTPEARAEYDREAWPDGKPDSTGDVTDGDADQPA